MKITICGFRCYENFTIELSPNNISNLSGDSGAGKSTIFSSIYWCLYGSLRNIYNNTKKFKKTNVTIELKDIKIYRQAKPNLLKVTVNDKEYIDKEGQEYINNIFGDEHIWKCTSYVAQDELNTILSGNLSEKIDILSKITFHNENIDDYISKIDDYISIVENEIKINEALSKNYNLEDINWEIYVPIENRIDFINVKNQLIELIPETQERINKNNLNLGKIDSINNRIEKITNNISDIENYLNNINKDEIIHNIENIYKELKNKEILELNKKKYEEYIELKKKLRNDLPDIIVDQNIITKTKIQESEYIKYFNMSKSINCDYNKESLNNKLKETKNIIDNQPDCKKGEEYRKLQNDLKNIKDTETNIEVENEISNLKTTIKNLEQNILKCPECKSDLIMYNNSLLKSCFGLDKKKELPSLKLKLENYNIKLKNIITRDNILSNLEKYNDKVKTLPNSLPIIELQKMYNIVSVINNIKIIDKVVTDSSILIEIYENDNIKKRLLDLGNVDEVNCDINVSVEDLNNYKKELKNIENYENTLNNYKNDLNMLNIELSELIQYDDSGLEIYLTNYKNQLNEIENQLNMWENMDKMKRERDSYNSIIYKIEKCTQKLNSAQTLKKISLDLECDILQTTLNNINTYLNILLKPIFDDPIIVKTKLNRITSKKGRSKSKLEFQIFFKGGEYDNIHDMSGGEKKRISLGLTIALNQVSGSPFILLDETMKSLQLDLQMKCLETIKDNINKTIIFIEHESVEGFYDHVIKL